MSDDERWCDNCFGDLPPAAKKYCCNACRQRAYRSRVRQGRQLTDLDEVQQTEMINMAFEFLSLERLKMLNPRARKRVRRDLERLLEAL